LSARAHIVSLAATAGFVVLAGFGTARADDNVQLFAGGQLDFANYVYVGATVALPGATIGNGFAIRGLADTGGYNYVSGDLGTVKASFGGGEIDAVYQWTTKNFWNDFYAGVNDTYTSLTPPDPSNKLSGDQVEPRIGVVGGATSGPWRTDYFGYYGTRLQDYEALIGVTHSVSSVWRLGVQGYSEGNPSYRLYQIGPYAGFAFDKTSELQFSTGEAWESGFTPRVYLRALYTRRL
jgi:hypothetical protein